MEYRIDRDALEEFIARQVELVESLSIPRLLADVAELRVRADSDSREEARALWLGRAWRRMSALRSSAEPERFVTAAPSPVTPAAALAAA